MNDADDTMSRLREHVDSFDADKTQKIDRSHVLVIVCPDDGVLVAYRGLCPKCGGDSWVPAGRVTAAHLKNLAPQQLDALRELLNESEAEQTATPMDRIVAPSGMSEGPESQEAGAEAAGNSNEGRNP